MKPQQSHAWSALGVTSLAAMAIFAVLAVCDGPQPGWIPEVVTDFFGLGICDGPLKKWVPQTVVTLVGLVGISWFVGRRLDLFDKGIHQRQQAAADQLTATERGNLNGAFRQAVEMMSDKSVPAILAGQSWLHKIAEGERPEAELARALLCSYIVGNTGPGSGHEDETELDAELRTMTRQRALSLLFASPDNGRYSKCNDVADLTGGKWHAMEFKGLDVRNTVFSKGDFTDATVEDAKFDKSKLRETTWAGVVGGPSPTSMKEVELCGARASSCTFRNIDFRKANMSNNGHKTVFTSCQFVKCNFEGANWAGAEFRHSTFRGCKGLTFELCCNADVSTADGLPEEVEQELKRKRMGGYQRDEASDLKSAD